MTIISPSHHYLYSLLLFELELRQIIKYQFKIIKPIARTRSPSSRQEKNYFIQFRIKVKVFTINNQTKCSHGISQ